MADHSKTQNPLRRLKSSLRELQGRHRERHRPTGFGFVFADRVDYLDPNRWDSITSHGGFFLKREVLRVIEQHGPENIQPRYAMIFRNEEPVAVLAVQIVRIRGEHLKPAQGSAKSRAAPDLLRRVLRPAMTAATVNVKERMIVAGNL